MVDHLSIKTFITYTRDSNERQFTNLSNNQPDNQKNVIINDVTVKNARAFGASLEANGFELKSHPTRLSYADFISNDEKIKNVYYGEMCDLIKQRLHPAHVVGFHHLIRSTVQKQGKTVREPARVAHSDYTVRNSISLFDKICTTTEHRKGKFMIINTWRNIHDENLIMNDHLAVCDSTSVTAPDDFVVMNLINEDNSVSESYRLDPRYNKRHRWYYYPYMGKDEVLMFTQYDSDPISRARYTFHCSIKDPNCPASSSNRESVEFRAILFFPNHETNTIPELIFNSTDFVNSAVEKIMQSLHYPDKWEARGRAWMQTTIAVPFVGVDLAIRGLVRNGAQRGILGLNGATVAQQDEIIRVLKSNRDFETIAKRNFPFMGQGTK